MKIKIKSCFIIFFCGFLLSQQNILLDKVAAVVDDKIVLLSDVVLAANALAAQENVNPSVSPKKYNDLLLKASESMIEQLVIIKMAEVDSVTVLEKDVEKALNRQIDNIISQSGSKEAAEQILGKKISDFKRSYKDDMEGKLIAEKYTNQLTMDIQITRPEIESFFSIYKDSIPSFPKEHEVRHILFEIKPSKKSIEETRSVALSVIDKIKNGMSFEEAAKEYSEDTGSKENGGYLGIVSRGTFVKEFEKAAFTLEINKISEPIQTSFGFHIIEVLERSGEKVGARHILIKTKTTDEDKENTYQNSLKIYQKIQTKNNFISSALEYSNDESTKENGGYLGWIDSEYYQVKELASVIKNIEKNVCSAPILTNFGYHLIWVDEIKEGGPPNLKENWIELEGMALNKKKSDWYSNWIKEIKTKVYIKRNPLTYPQIAN